MADSKISNLTEITNPSNSDVLLIVNGGSNKKIQVSNFGRGVSESLLSTTNNIDLNTSTASSLFTSLSGTSTVITKVVIRNASTSLTTASVSFGWNSSAFNDVISNATHTELTGNTIYTALGAKTGATVGTSSQIFKIKANTLQGAAATVSVDVFGVII